MFTLRAVTLCVVTVATAVHAQTGRALYEIAFADATHINVMAGDGSRPPRPLRDQRAILLTSGWSPDGNTIAYLGCRPLNAPLPLHFALCLMSSTGADRLKPVDVPVEPFVEWSPDSRRLAFSSSYEDPARSNPRVQQGRQALSSAVYVVDVGTRKSVRVTPLGQNRFPAWSADGRYLAFSGDIEAPGNIDIYVVDGDGRNLKRVTQSPTIDVQPQWSPRGDSIAFVAAPRPAQRGTEGGIYVMRPDGTEARRIWRPALASGVVWSPDGRSLLVRGSPSAVVDVNTGAVGNELGQGVGDATFAPDGRSVVYRTGARAQPEGDGIYALDVRTGSRTRLASGSSFSVSPLSRKP